MHDISFLSACDFLGGFVTLIVGYDSHFLNVLIVYKYFMSVKNKSQDLLKLLSPMGNGCTVAKPVC
jgi:hypothetical protein